LESKWTTHLLSEFEKVLKQTKFDGIHLDQYGDPKDAYDSLGTHIQLDEPIAQTITATHTLVDQYRKDGAVVFNCVTNWPVEMASAADEDIIYIEVWDPYIWFSELHTLIAYAQSLGHNKPVVLAAYVHPGSTANPFLMDAVIFASGGGHIELGENNGYLADPYFPSYDTLNAEQAAVLRRYYDFSVRYQNLIGPSTNEATRQWINKIAINGLKVGLNQTADVFALLRESSQGLSLNLVNMTNIGSTEWNKPANFPTPAKNLTVTLNGMQTAVKSVSFASADEEVFTLEPLKFIQTGDQVSFEIPSLKIWDMVVIEY
jgi:dextranase